MAIRIFRGTCGTRSSRRFYPRDPNALSPVARRWGEYRWQATQKMIIAHAAMFRSNGRLASPIRTASDRSLSDLRSNSSACSGNLRAASARDGSFARPPAGRPTVSNERESRAAPERLPSPKHPRRRRGAYRTQTRRRPPSWGPRGDELDESSRRMRVGNDRGEQRRVD
jgi:hypothetical protein